MAARKITWVFLCAVFATVACAQVKNDDDDEPTVFEVVRLADGLHYEWDKVIYIDDKNWKTVRETYPRLLINFGKEDCGKCKELKRSYGKVSSIVSYSAGPSDAWAYGYVDIDRSPVLKTLFEINMYPLLFHVVDEGIYPFTLKGEQRRNVDDQTDYMREWEPVGKTKSDLGFLDDIELLHNGNWEVVWEISEDGPVLLNVYAPWCSHCKDMAPALAGASEVVADFDRPWTIFKMNGSGEKEASRALSVSQYPTLLIFYKDQAYRYTGGHLEREIVNYLKFWKPNEENEIDLRVDAFTPVKEEDVLELDDSTFFNAVEEYKTIAAFIYAPWCGHCKSFHPIFDKAASYLAAKDIPVQMIRVDGSANREVAWRYNVSSYPFVAVRTRNACLCTPFRRPFPPPPPSLCSFACLRPNP
jgi:thiol-disulfide isomerase/thioredoxin